MRVSKISTETTSVFQKFRQIVDVDDWNNQPRIEDWNIVLSRIGLNKLVDGFGIERVQGAFGRWLIIKLPKLFCDIPWHHELVARDLRLGPSSRKILRRDINQRRKRGS